MERWDLYDKERNTIGECIRGDAFADNTYHIIVDIWTLADDGTFLVTRRSKEKTYAGYWENTAGSILKGETPEEGAIRELKEEAGVIADIDKLHHLNRRIEEGAHAHWDTYFYFTGTRPPVHLQEGETDAYQWVTSAELDIMAENGELAGPVIRRYTVVRDQLKELYDEYIHVHGD